MAGILRVIWLSNNIHYSPCNLAAVGGAPDWAEVASAGGKGARQARRGRGTFRTLLRDESGELIVAQCLCV